MLVYSLELKEQASEGFSLAGVMRMNRKNYTAIENVDVHETSV
jgi:hypothetical protein